MNTRNITFFPEKITPINLCGETILWQIKVDGIFEKPFEILPVEGEHDFNKCAGCQRMLKEIERELIEVHEGKKNKFPFPFCCENHKKLLKLQGFKKEDFDNVPEMVARKLIYTHQTILNCQNNEDWFKEITDYIELAISSFGSMPKGYGGALYLDYFFQNTIHNISKNSKLNRRKKEKLLAFIENIKTPKKVDDSEHDVEVLIKIYEKWINLFPFELDFFKELKQKYLQALPILQGKTHINIYSGLSKTEIHTKQSMYDSLLKLTDRLLTEINVLTFYENNVIDNIEKLHLDYIISERKQKLKKGYLSNIKIEEIPFHKLINEWFEDEKKFIEEIKPLFIKDENVKNRNNVSQNEVNTEQKNNFNSMPFDRVKKHFMQLVTEKSTNTKPFLTEQDLETFLKAAFTDNIQLSSKLRFNMVDGEMGAIREIFYSFYFNSRNEYEKTSIGIQAKYIGLLKNYFEGFANLEGSNFARKYTKKR